MHSWWQRAVVYQIYPRSFADGDGDGIGDLAGVRSRLEHVAWLGADAVWLSPIYPSPMADFGYDISDYCDVDPVFGSLADLDLLVGEAHDLGLRVVLDWVPNHTSDQHPWFLDARSGRDSPRRNWYVWADPSPDGGPPKNWVRAWGDSPAWTFDEPSGQWYLHYFLPAQPDLNWDEPGVVAAMHDTLRFWLDRGVDGFRMDVINCIGKPAGLPDNPREVAGLPQCAVSHSPRTHELLRGIRGVLEEYPGDRVMIGEVALFDSDLVARHYGDGDELHLSFNFPSIYAPYSARSWRNQIERVLDHIDPVGWPTWVLSNHDVPRHRTRYGSEAAARLGAVLLLGLRGTPFLYAGEELGLEDADVPPERVVDPGGRDGCRAPLPWDATPDHGWPGDEPWLPWAPDPATRNVASERDDPASVVHLYRRLIATRRSSEALSVGDMALLPVAHPQVVAVERHDQASGDRRWVVANIGPESATVSGPWDGAAVEVCSLGRLDGGPFDGRLEPDHAVVLKPV